MRIIINSKEDRKKLRLVLPLSFIKSRLFLKIMIKNGGSDIDLSELKKMKKLFNQSYRVLKRYIKKYGHFYLVQIESADGDRVIIRV